MNIVRRLPKTRLEYKYRHELHCNEVMLLPYYVAAMNIEHTFWEQTGGYEAFPSICLVDTFETAEKAQTEFGFFNPENTDRVKRQKAASIFVVIGNPPYNAHQINANDNNKNRKYEVVDDRVRLTYTTDSTATNKVSLSDVYVKAFRWAADRVGPDAIVAYVSNNGFLDGNALDGMRNHLAGDFTTIRHLDFKGNARTSGARRKREGGNIFDDKIRVGIGITLLIRNSAKTGKPTQIWLHQVPDFWRANQKRHWLGMHNVASKVEWRKVTPNKAHVWLTEGLRPEFGSFVSIGDKSSDGVPESFVFRNYGRGVATSRDDWVYRFDHEELATSIRSAIEFYNKEMDRWLARKRPKKDESADDFVEYNDKRLKWSRDLLADLEGGNRGTFSTQRIRRALYRPFTAMNLYFDRLLNEEVYVFPEMFPRPDTESENLVICVTDAGSEKSFMLLASNRIVDLHLVGAGSSCQCFPFYTYEGENGARRENISLSMLTRFQTHYGDDAITRWEIFYYIYAVLHHPEYRSLYAANLRRELPRVPMVGSSDAKAFRSYAEIGRQLADLHVHYETAVEYPLQRIENPEEKLNWRVEKMPLTKDKTGIIYNDFLTLAGVPEAAFTYRLATAARWNG